MNLPIHKKVSGLADNSGLAAVFRDILGWDSVNGETEAFQTSDGLHSGVKIASLLNGIVVFCFQMHDLETISPNLQKDISKSVGEKYAERLVVFESKIFSTWLWPKKSSSGALTYEKLVVNRERMPDFLAQRLAALRFTSEDFMRGVTVSDVREKLRGAFDTSKVTKAFYKKFEIQHEKLASSISGLALDEANSYATLLMNRLMFIYFLQKKEFLNSDANYLSTCLKKLQALEKSGTFYNFYKDLLLVLFFEGLNKKSRNFNTPQIEEIIGNVPYVNGGIFGETELEKNNVISIPDEIFASILGFFDEFTWHLDTRPTGNTNEINPEVIGYIFEQYINFTAGGKRENGAYYTKHDVTSYMVGQTLVPKILELLSEAGLAPLRNIPNSGDRYISEQLLHGWSTEINSWVKVDVELEKLWAGNPDVWNELDAIQPDPDCCLPGETWVETFHRRDQVNQLRISIESGDVLTIDDLISKNLGSQLLLQDSISQIDNEAEFKSVWMSLEKLSVIDPTCGSGAFLFAALEILEDVYAGLIEIATQLSTVSKYCESVCDEVNEHPNRRYFIRKKAALSNLYGTDIMQDAIETAKLRVFLALASCLESSDTIEPLPDLDFNFKTGNLIVGLLDKEDILRISDSDIFASAELGALDPTIEEFSLKYEEFVDTSFRGDKDLTSIKLELQQMSTNLRSETNRVMGRMLMLGDDETDNWVKTQKPFHWFIEFPAISQRGGFDIVIGNPPYVRLNQSARRDLREIGVRGFQVFDCPDLYAFCYERALQILGPGGRHAFIVPVNLAFSDDFAELRKVLSDSNSGQWWSTYDQLPQGLFEGAGVRNTIHIGSRSGAETKVSSHHQIFTAATRHWLFSSLDYTPINAQGQDAISRAGICNPLIESIKAAKGFIGRRTPSSMCLKSTANYWVPVYPKRPPVLDLNFEPTQIIDRKVKELGIGDNESEEVLLALLSGKIGFIWWQSTGDGFDTIEESFTPLRNAFSGKKSTKLTALSKAVIKAGLENTVVNMYKGSNYVGIRWAGIRGISDSFDFEILKEMKLEGFWRDLNILYRQIMRANDSRQMNQDLGRNQSIWDLQP